MTSRNFRWSDNLGSTLRSFAEVRSSRRTERLQAFADTDNIVLISMITTCVHIAKSIDYEHYENWQQICPKTNSFPIPFQLKR